MSPGSGTADGVRAERFVVCHNPDAAARDAGVQHQTPDGGVEGFTLRNPYTARVSAKA